MKLDEQTEKDLLEKVGKEATDATKKAIEQAEKSINQKAEEMAKGLMKKEDFDKFKEEALEPINEQLKKLDILEKAQEEQGKKLINFEKSAPNSKSFEDFIMEMAPKFKEAKNEGKAIFITGKELKSAGVTSISGSIQDMTSPPGSPYAPGLAGNVLQLFDIIRNPNYVVNHVNLGRTNSSRLAWANETDLQGAAAEVDENNAKPLVQHKFQVETSTAKKVAGYVAITDEFDQDLPQFATAVKRMLQNDVLRGWDDAIQAAIIAVAHAFEITGLNGKIQAANYWDAILAMMAQVRSYNFIPNTVGINPLTNVLLKASKSSTDEYLLPSFVEEINSILTQANKVATTHAFAGDLMQYNVDIYDDFRLKVGLINDDLIYNRFAVVGEIRYHRYISDARKKAICYDDLETVVAAIKRP